MEFASFADHGGALAAMAAAACYFETNSVVFSNWLGLFLPENWILAYS